MALIKKLITQIIGNIIALFEPVIISCFLGVLVFRLLFDLPNFTMTVSSFNWPFILIISVLLFRRILTEKFSQLIELSHRGMLAKFNLPKVEVQEKEASEQFAEFNNEEPSGTFDRDKIEKVMKMAASWGYNMAQMGFKSTPVPVVDWSNEQPIIKFGSSAITNSRVEAEINLIISEIMTTQEALDGLSVFERQSSVSGLIPSRQSVLNKKLIRLHSQLRELDPTSIFLPQDPK